jgi:hypothetical protein
MNINLRHRAVNAVNAFLAIVLAESHPDGGASGVMSAIRHVRLLIEW